MEYIDQSNDVKPSTGGAGKGILFFLLLIVIVVGFLMSNGTIKNPFVGSKNQLSCTKTEHNEYGVGGDMATAEEKSEIDINFHANGDINTIKKIFSIKHGNQTSYDISKSVEVVGDGICEIFGLTGNEEWDDVNLINKTVCTGNFSEMNEDSRQIWEILIGSTKENIKDYYVADGYTCK